MIPQGLPFSLKEKGRARLADVGLTEFASPCQIVSASPDRAHCESARDLTSSAHGER